MTELERITYLQLLEKKKKKALKNKKAALEFLKQLGILTEKGNLRAPYNSVCTPEEVA